MFNLDAEAFDSLASKYDDLTRRNNYFSIKWIESHVHKLEGLSECRVLDLGCGTGLNAKALCEKRTGVHADGVDISQRMLDHARATGRYTNLYARDLNEPLADLPSDVYDLVIAFGFFEILSHLDVCLAECRRLLKVDGLLWASFRRYEAEDIGSPPRVQKFGLTLTGYSAGEILHLMRREGMRVLAIEPIDALITRAGFAYPYYIVQAQKAPLTGG